MNGVLPKRVKNIVYDLDETLVKCVLIEEGVDPEAYSKKEINPKYEQHFVNIVFKENNGSLAKEMYIVLVRKGVRELIKEAHDKGISAVIWSAGLEEYVTKVVELIFCSAKIQPILVKHRKDVVFKSAEKQRYPCKPLQNLTEHFSHINSDNTIMIDDTDETFQLNKKNAIHVDRFPKSLKDEPDDIICKVKEWLLENHSSHLNSASSKVVIGGVAKPKKET